MAVKGSGAKKGAVKPAPLPVVEVFDSGSKNSNLSWAKGANNSEFYTQWADIEREMNAYLEYDPRIFRGKTILLSCDEPESAVGKQNF